MLTLVNRHWWWIFNGILVLHSNNLLKNSDRNTAINGGVFIIWFDSASSNIGFITVIIVAINGYTPSVIDFYQQMTHRPFTAYKLPRDRITREHMMVRRIWLTINLGAATKKATPVKQLKTWLTINSIDVRVPLQVDSSKPSVCARFYAVCRCNLLPLSFGLRGRTRGYFSSKQAHNHNAP